MERRVRGCAGLVSPMNQYYALVSLGKHLILPWDSEARGGLQLGQKSA